MMQRPGLRPPSSVPGPYRGPLQPPGIPAQRLPGARYWIAQGNETLAWLAQQLYGNPREATRLFNANRAGVIRSDKTPGFLTSLHDRIPAGTPVLLP